MKKTEMINRKIQKKNELKDNKKTAFANNEETDVINFF